MCMHVSCASCLVGARCPRAWVEALLEMGSTSLLSAGWLSFVVLPRSQAPVFMGNVFKANEGNGNVPRGFNFYGQSLSSQ